MKRILEPQYAIRIWRISHLCWLSILSSAFYGFYFCTFCASVVYLTSLNFWRNPVFGFRRNLDIFCVVTGLSYHFYLALSLEQPFMYMIIVLIGISFYLKARQTPTQDWSSFYHCIMHICGNLSNVILYKSLYGLRFS
ncbi:hypothetical protein EDD86DRAFT_202727 [Gorgonomyces haynaldii]|nr:hypothetical protein EDD86DRAFT_202727 [Gorgonomyces haynaldii]